jgi:hypothetical protein
VDTNMTSIKSTNAVFEIRKVLWIVGTALAGSTGPNVDWLYVVMMASLRGDMA